MNEISSLQDNDIILILDHNNNLKRVKLSCLCDIFCNYNSFLKLNKKLDDFSNYLTSLSSTGFYDEHLTLDEAVDVYANKSSLNDILDNPENLKTDNVNWIYQFIYDYALIAYTKCNVDIAFSNIAVGGKGSEDFGDSSGSIEDYVIAMGDYIGLGDDIKKECNPDDDGKTAAVVDFSHPRPTDKQIENYHINKYPAFNNMTIFNANNK